MGVDNVNLRVERGQSSSLGLAESPIGRGPGGKSSFERIGRRVTGMSHFESLQTFLMTFFT
jgi:hypothetical protein